MPAIVGNHFLLETKKEEEPKDKRRWLGFECVTQQPGNVRGELFMSMMAPTLSATKP
jgi:hypothetical protein